MIYEATFGFNVRRYVRKQIEADTPDEAIAFARAMAQEVVDEASFEMTATAGFDDANEAEASLLILGPDENEILDTMLPAVL